MDSMEGNAMPIRDFNGGPNVVRSRVAKAEGCASLAVCVENSSVSELLAATATLVRSDGGLRL
jgi:hypothetical protein